jgi:hypothetical protein
MTARVATVSGLPSVVSKSVNSIVRILADFLSFTNYHPRKFGDIIQAHIKGEY